MKVAVVEKDRLADLPQQGMYPDEGAVRPHHRRAGREGGLGAVEAVE